MHDILVTPLFFVDRPPLGERKKGSLAAARGALRAPHSDSTATNAHRPFKSSAPPSDVMRAADLLEREKQLTEELRFASDASYRRRVEIEEELAEISRELKRLGFPPSS